VSPIKQRKPGRVALAVAERLKAGIAAGDFQVGQYLPCVKLIGEQHKVSPETARRALKLLEAEHWVSCHPGHGFRVTARGNEPGKSAPVAFVLSGIGGTGAWSSFCLLLQAAIHRAAAERGWSVLGIVPEGRRAPELAEHLRAARASGLLMDTDHRPLIAALSRLGMPVVMVEEPAPEARLDCVSQNNFGGAVAAAEYLVGRGHRRVGWYGMISPTIQSRERWGGALAGLRDGGAGLAPGHTVDSTTPDARQRLREVLASPERPTALLSLWWDGAADAARVAVEAGLALGRDLEIVSWCPEEQLPEFRAALPGGRLPAAMVWSLQQLADAALARLADRRDRPEMPPARICVETRLRPAERDEPVRPEARSS
jgi:DNA-binding LacI/PurR family transcriptional regulator